VNTFTPNRQGSPAVAADPAGNFVVVWQSQGQEAGGYYGDYGGIFGQRFDSAGEPRGSEFHVNTFTPNRQRAPAVAADAAGNFVVVWESQGEEGQASYGDLGGIFGQRFDSTGAPRGSEFHVNTYTTYFQGQPAVSSDPAGNFVVVWQSNGQEPGGYYGSYGGIFGQRFDSTGTPRGPEFHVNTFTPNTQEVPSVAADAAGNFVVVWQSHGQESGGGYGDYGGIFGRWFDSAGAPQGAEFHVNTFTRDRQGNPAVAAGAAGNFVVVWQSYAQEAGQDTYQGIFGQRFMPIAPAIDRPPVARVSPVGPVECSSPAGAAVTLDGSASSDPDSTPGTHDDIAAFDWFEDFGLPSQTQLGEGEILKVTLPLGSHAITLRATDKQGSAGTAGTPIVVADTTAPVVQITLSRTLLWPPDHKLVPILATVTASDACGDPGILLRSVTSSEPDDAPGAGDGRTTGDIRGADVGTPDFKFTLRAEREAKGPGRVYTVTYAATDPSGNTATAAAVVSVPHARRSKGNPTEP
jgi:hypothetical protein